MEREPDSKLYFAIRDALEVFAKINNRLQIIGEENIPSEGGALVCPNHENYSDPFFVGIAFRERMLHFLAWHGIDEMPLFGPLFRRIGTMHPIKESYGVAHDKEEVKEVLGGLRELLESGELCCIFPAGAIKHWIRPPGKEDDFKPGAPRLAAQAGVPIIPVALHGTRWVVPNIINFHDFGGPDSGIWLPGALPSKVRVRVGEFFHVDPAAAGDRDVALAEAERLKQTIEELVESIRPKSLFEMII